MKKICLVFVPLWFILISPAANAHSYFAGGGNESLALAKLIPDPAKSRAVYANLPQNLPGNLKNSVQYYMFQAVRGQKINLMLFKNTSRQDRGFMPGFVLFGPGITNSGIIPDFVETPPGTGYVAVNGVKPAVSTYEAFTPSSFNELANISINAPSDGTYYIAVFNSGGMAPRFDKNEGRYGLTIGEKESFTFVEWILFPLTFLKIYSWEGQSLLMIISPALATLCIGLFLLILRGRKGRHLGGVIAWLAAVSGLLYLATSATFLTQMIFSIVQSRLEVSAVITLFFAILPAILGVLTLRHAVITSGTWTPHSRIYLAFLAAFAFVMWAGFVMGPILACVGAILPLKSFWPHYTRSRLKTVHG